jgi:hypothetical protein
VYYECANPIVKRNFLEGKYDAAVTFTEVLTERPGEFQLIKLIGRTNMSWLVYSATRPRTEEIAVTSRAKELFMKNERTVP